MEKIFLRIRVYFWPICHYCLQAKSCKIIRKRKNAKVKEFEHVPERLDAGQRLQAVNPFFDPVFAVQHYSGALQRRRHADRRLVFR